MGDDAVEKLSNQTAELRGMIVALELASEAGGPVLIRYDSMYAALIASSVWRAKKHKPLAARAHRAWQLAMEALKGKLWLKHVKGHSGARLNERVDELANAGRCGEATYASLVN